MPLGCHSKNQWHEELLDVADNGLKRDGLDVELVLPVEGSPLELLRFVLKELCGKRDRRCRREASLASLKCPLDRFGEKLALERKEPRQGAQVVEVLHPCIGDAELHHRLELLCYNRLPGIGEQHGCRPVQDSRERRLNRRRRYGVPEPDVELHWDSGLLQIAEEADPYPFVVRPLFDLAGGHARWVEDQSIVHNRENTDLLESGLEAAGIAGPDGEEICVPRWPVGLLRPKLKEQCPFQNEGRLVLRLADTKEQAFQRVLRQQQPKIFLALTREVEETLPNGSCDVGDGFAQESDSIYGRMTLETRQTFAASQSSSIVAFFSR